MRCPAALARAVGAPRSSFIHSMARSDCASTVLKWSAAGRGPVNCSSLNGVSPMRICQDNIAVDHIDMHTNDKTIAVHRMHDPFAHGECLSRPRCKHCAQRIVDMMPVATKRETRRLIFLGPWMWIGYLRGKLTRSTREEGAYASPTAFMY